MTMNKEDDILFKKIKEAAQTQKKEASFHKNLYRSLWIISALISFAVAFFSSFKFSIYNVTSSTIATVLALILPMVTGYVVLRSPEKLWVFEVDTRNQLNDLASELEFLMDRGEEFDRETYEKKYLLIMEQSNKKWVSIKSG